MSQLLSQFIVFKICVYLRRTYVLQHISDSEATTHLHGATTLVQQFIVYLARTPHACRDASARHLKSVCYQEPDYSKLLGAGDLWSLVKTIVTRSVTIF